MKHANTMLTALVVLLTASGLHAQQTGFPIGVFTFGGNDVDCKQMKDTLGLLWVQGWGGSLNFEREFEKAPIEEKKVLVRRCISHVVVDREKHLARFYVRRIPAVVPQLETLLESKRAPTGLVSALSSGGPNFIETCNFLREFELNLV